MSLTDHERAELFKRHPVPWGYKEGGLILDATGKGVMFQDVRRIQHHAIESMNVIGPRDPAKLALLLDEIRIDSDVTSWARRVVDAFNTYIRSGDTEAAKGEQNNG